MRIYSEKNKKLILFYRQEKHTHQLSVITP